MPVATEPVYRPFETDPEGYALLDRLGRRYGTLPGFPFTDKPTVAAVIELLRVPLVEQKCSSSRAARDAAAAVVKLHANGERAAIAAYVEETIARFRPQAAPHYRNLLLAPPVPPPYA